MKEEVLKEMYEVLRAKENSYDQHIKESSYWTCYDCISIVTKTEDELIINLSKKIFDRLKWYI